MASYDIDFEVATSEQIEAALCERIERIRLARNMTQETLAEEAGVSKRTIGRMAKGEGVSLDTFIRVLIALGIGQGLVSMLPDPSVRPVERVGKTGSERKRARPDAVKKNKGKWLWGDGGDHE